MVDQKQTRQDGKDSRGPAYAFWIVVVGIGAVTFVFVLSMIFFGLVRRDVFDTPDQVIAALTSLFGVVGTLVGTYFGIKASGDARSGLEQARQDTHNLADKMLSQVTTTAGSAAGTTTTTGGTTTPAEGVATPRPGERSVGGTNPSSPS